MKDSLSDSNEDLYYLTTTTDIFDFTTADTIISSEVKAQTNRFLASLKVVISIPKTSLFGIISLLLETIVFGAAYFVYLKKKVVQFIAFLDHSKDTLVSGLMWRRGLIFRPATHGGVMVLAAVAVIAGGLFTRGQIAAQDLTLQETILKSQNTSETLIPTNRPRSEVVNYQVVSGDTMSKISIKYDVSVEAIKWANNMTDETILPEQKLKIPPVSGIVYQVKDGDTLEKIASKYSADKQTIADFPFNYIDETLSLRVGQDLYIPGGVMPAPAAPKNVGRRVVNSPFVAGSGLLSWPAPAHISQYFSWFHPALDLADPYGTPIYAAASGKIIDAQKQTYSFGWYCIEDIGGGYTVAYAHMSDQACYVGQQVTKGQYIGAVGTSGRATGPHLHLEVRRNGQPVNPLSLL